MVIYVVHKRVTADVGALATLVSKSYKNFCTLLLAKSYDVIVSQKKKKEKKKLILSYIFMD